MCEILKHENPDTISNVDTATFVKKIMGVLRYSPALLEVFLSKEFSKEIVFNREVIAVNNSPSAKNKL